MAKSFRLMVLTPEREFYNADATYVSVQTIAGSVGIMAGHVPMVTALGVGEHQHTGLLQRCRGALENRETR